MHSRQIDRTRPSNNISGLSEATLLTHASASHWCILGRRFCVIRFNQQDWPTRWQHLAGRRGMSLDFLCTVFYEWRVVPLLIFWTLVVDWRRVRSGELKPHYSRVSRNISSTFMHLILPYSLSREEKKEAQFITHAQRKVVLGIRIWLWK